MTRRFVTIRVGIILLVASAATPASALPIISPGSLLSVDPGPPELVVLPIEITGATHLVTWPACFYRSSCPASSTTSPG
jgi:hypothetical protein